MADQNLKRALLTGTLVLMTSISFKRDTYVLNKIPVIANIENSSFRLIDYKTALSLVTTNNNVVEILNNNKYLKPNEKKIIYQFFNNIIKNKPEMNLTIFKENLKNLKIVSLSENEYHKIKYSSNFIAYFDSTKKTIFYREKYNKANFLNHELGHLLNVICFNNVKCAYYVDDNNSFKEGFNTLFTNDINNQNNSEYFKEQTYIKILTEMFGSKKIENLFLNGEGSVIQLLKKYETDVEIKRILELISDLTKNDAYGIENDKKTYFEIVKKFIKWSRCNALEKYEILKKENVIRIDEAYINQLLITDVLLMKAFNLSVDEIYNLEKESDIEIPLECEKIINNKIAYKNLIYNNINFIISKKYFIDSLDLVTFNYINDNIEYNIKLR